MARWIVKKIKEIVKKIDEENPSQPAGLHPRRLFARPLEFFFLAWKICMEAQFRGPLKLSGTITALWYWGVWGELLIFSPIMPRDASLSEGRWKFFQSGRILDFNQIPAQKRRVSFTEILANYDIPERSCGQDSAGAILVWLPADVCQLARIAMATQLKHVAFGAEFRIPNSCISCRRL